VRNTQAIPPHQIVEMSLELAQIIAMLLETYALVGLIFALAFLPRAALRLDPRLHGASPMVRLLILPGVAALWPLTAWRWATGASAPIERNPHRRAAARPGQLTGQR
jgi:hypothetical protein